MSQKVKIHIDQQPRPYAETLLKQLPGIINDDSVEFVLEDSDVILTSTFQVEQKIEEKLRQGKKIIFNNLTHYWEGINSNVDYIKEYSLKHPDAKIFLITNNVFWFKEEWPEDKCIYYDPLYYYFTHYFQGITPKAVPFVFEGGQDSKYWPATTLSDLESTNRTKVFLSPCRLYLDHDRGYYRHKLFLKLYEYKHLGYMSGPGRTNGPGVIEKIMGWPDKPMVLVPEGYDIDSTEDIPFFGVVPPNKEYFNNSFISIYGETLETGNYVAPTEKSYIPLWKGHLIFPFGTCRLVEALRTKDFRFPDEFIDYSYDHIEDPEERWQVYSKELDRLMNLTIDEWKNIWTNSLELRLHNQNVFSKPLFGINFSKILDCLGVDNRAK